MRRLAPLATLLVALVAGCGGSGEETFEEDGFAITFKYPGSFDEAEDVTVASAAGGSAKARAAVGLDEHNLILVTRFDLNATITAENLEQFKEEVDSVVGQAAGQELDGRRVEYGGLPGYEYEFDITEPTEARSRFVAVFDGNRQYTINCQHTEEKREELLEGCDRALETLERRAE